MTAVEWLEDLYYPNYIPKEIFEQAKIMEKEQQDDFAIGFAGWCQYRCVQKEDLKSQLEIYKKTL